MCRASRPSVTGSVLLRKRSPGSSSSLFSFSPPSACFHINLRCAHVLIIPCVLLVPLLLRGLSPSLVLQLGPISLFIQLPSFIPLRPPHLDVFFPLAAWTLFYCEVSYRTGTFQTHYRNIEKERIPSQLLLTFRCVYSCSPHFLVFYLS